MRETLAALVAIVSFAAVPAFAGIIDTPLPVLPQGDRVGKSIYQVTGVRTSAGIAAAFHCTNVDTVDVEIGVEIFDFNGTPLNDVSAFNGSKVLLSGETRTFATANTLAYDEDEIITLSSDANQGSARISATSKKIICSAQLFDSVNAVPVLMTPLTLVAKKQKGD
jgi:hypothetical protein